MVMHVQQIFVQEEVPLPVAVAVLLLLHQVLLVVKPAAPLQDVI